MNKKVLIWLVVIVLIGGAAFYFTSGASLQGKFSINGSKSLTAPKSLNTGTVTTSTGPIDLTVKSTSFSYSSILLQPKICVTGVLASNANVILSYEVSQNGQTVGNATYSVPAGKLTNGACTVVDIDASSWGMGLSGDMRADVTVDSTNLITETNENNNNTVSDFNVAES